MKQAIIIAAASATVAQAAPRSGRGRRGGVNAKLLNDKAFLSHASTFNVDIGRTSDFLEK